MMKKIYIKPATDIIILDNAMEILAGSGDQTGWEEQLAPPAIGTDDPTLDINEENDDL